MNSELLKYNKYFHGESECPFSDSNKIALWNAEKHTISEYINNINIPSLAYYFSVNHYLYKNHTYYRYLELSVEYKKVTKSNIDIFPFPTASTESKIRKENIASESFRNYFNDLIANYHTEKAKYNL